MDESEIQQGTRRAWLLVAALIALVALWTWLTIHWNQDEVPPGWHQGGSPFVPGEAPGAIGYPSGGRAFSETPATPPGRMGEP